MNESVTKKPRRKIARKLLYVLGCACIVFLAQQTVSFVNEARVAISIGKDSTNTPKQRIVNKSDFIPPTDGRLRLDQIEMMLHVIESSDSVGKISTETARVNRIVELLNEYTASLAEYRWIRSRISAIVSRPPTSVQDTSTAMGPYTPMFLTEFVKSKTFFRDSLDKSLL